MTDWISIDERLPEKKDYKFFWLGERHFIAVMVYGVDITLGKYSTVTKKWTDFNGEIIDDVTHWLPIPREPKKMTDKEKECLMWSLMG